MNPDVIRVPHPYQPLISTAIFVRKSLHRQFFLLVLAFTLLSSLCLAPAAASTSLPTLPCGPAAALAPTGTQGTGKVSGWSSFPSIRFLRVSCTVSQAAVSLNAAVRWAGDRGIRPHCAPLSGGKGGREGLSVMRVLLDGPAIVSEGVGRRNLGTLRGQQHAYL